jgi:hypothetical protein
MIILLTTNSIKHVFLKKLTAAQLVEKFRRLRNSYVHYRAHKIVIGSYPLTRDSQWTYPKPDESKRILEIYSSKF